MNYSNELKPAKDQIEKTPERSSRRLQFVFVAKALTKSSLSSYFPVYEIDRSRLETKLVQVGEFKSSGENIPIYERQDVITKNFELIPTGDLVYLTNRLNGESIIEICYGKCDKSQELRSCQYFLAFVNDKSKLAPKNRPLVVAGCNGTDSDTRGGQRYLRFYSEHVASLK